MSNVVVPKENVHPSRIVVNVLSGQSVPPFSLMRIKVPSRYRWLPHTGDARSVGGRPALLILLVIMLAGVSGCATVEDAARRTPEMGKSIDGGSLPRELDPDLSTPNHSASLPMSGPAQSTSDGHDLSAKFVPESDFEGKSSGLIVRTLARLRVGSIIPMPDEVSIRVPEIWSLRPPVVKALGDDLAPLRPPLRQSWLYHRTVPPAGYEMERRLPDSAFLALGERVSSGPFRNTSAGFRDQPLLHPEPASLPAERSKLPEIGPPPPHHTVKTFAVFTVASLVGIGVYALAPSSFTGTTKDGQQYEESWNQFKDAWTKPPVFDTDNPAVNYLGHPYFGAQFYLSQRNYGESPLYSFLFSTFMSTAFEYFIESWAEQPSINDLIVTPVLGSILGEGIFLATQEMRKDGFTTAEKIVVTVINPMYVFQNGYR